MRARAPVPPLHPPSAVTDGTAHTRSLAPSPCPFPSPLPRCFHAEDHENRRGAAVTQLRATGPGTKPIQLRTAPPNASPTAAAAASSSLSFVKLHPSVVGRSVQLVPKIYRLLLPPHCSLESQIPPPLADCTASHWRIGAGRGHIAIAGSYRLFYCSACWEAP